MRPTPENPPRLHLIKLSVGSESVATLRAWQSARSAERRRAGLDPRPRHITRMTPRRADELLPGGSIYWVIQGAILARQRLAAIEPMRGEDGVPRCALVLEPALIPVEPRPRRPFQGWRYLKPEDAPPDLAAQGADAPPPGLSAALDALGLPARDDDKDHDHNGDA